MSMIRLDSPDGVIRCLLTYTDWWQPSTGSIIQVAAARRQSEAAQGFRSGLLETMDERSELTRRAQLLGERDRRILVLWYVGQLPAEEIARSVGISRRQCFRLRAAAIQKIVKLGEPEQAA